MRLGAVRRRRENDGAVASGEAAVEPGNDGLERVVPLERDLEVRGEIQIGHGAGLEIELENGACVSADAFSLDEIYRRLFEHKLLHRSVVEAPDVVPEGLALSLV